MKKIYFGGGAWSSSFFIGVIKSLEEKYGKELNKKFIFGGVSIGAYFALLLTLGYDYKKAKNIFCELSNKANKDGIFNFYKNSEYHNNMLSKVLIDEDAYKICEKRNLEIGISRCFDKHEIYRKWTSNEDLKKCIHASLHVPFYCKYQGYYDNEIAFDGGFFLDNDVLKKYDITIGRGDYYDINMSPTLNEILFPHDKFKLELFLLDGYNKTTIIDIEKIDKKNRKTINKKSFLMYFIIHYFVLIEIFFYVIYNFNYLPLQFLTLGYFQMSI